jgi:hypothetical protein
LLSTPHSCLNILAAPSLARLSASCIFEIPPRPIRVLSSLSKFDKPRRLRV